jgi:hypothetical protein
MQHHIADVVEDQTGATIQGSQCFIQQQACGWGDASVDCSIQIEGYG